MTDDAGAVEVAAETELKETVGLDRVLFFSDAVVAIAITLLALPVVDAAIAAKTATAFFAHDSESLIAAAVSFVAISGSWREHHRLFRDVRGYSEVVVSVQFLWLASIVALPIATAFIVVGRTDRIALVIYLGVITLTAGLTRLQHVLLRHLGMLRRGHESTVEVVNDWLPIGLRVIALVCVAVFPQLGLWPLLILVVGTVFALVTRPIRHPASWGIRA